MDWKEVAETIGNLARNMGAFFTGLAAYKTARILEKKANAEKNTDEKKPTTKIKRKGRK